MEFFTNLKNAVSSNLQDVQTYATKKIDQGSDIVADGETTLRNGAHDVVDYVSEQNHEYYSGMKDEFQEKVTSLSKKVGMEETGAAINKGLDIGGDISTKVAHAVTDHVHTQIADVGTFYGEERQQVADLIEKAPIQLIENKEVRNAAKVVKDVAKENINRDLLKAPFEVAKTGVEATALTLKAAIDSEDPFANPDDLNIGETKILKLKGKGKIHNGVGGGLSVGGKFATARLGENEYQASFTVNTSLKVGVGASAAEGVDANIGTAQSAKVTVRGSAEMLNNLKETYQKRIPTFADLKNTGAREIKFGGDVGHFVDVSAFPLSGKAQTKLGVDMVWTPENGTKPELSASMTLSQGLGGPISLDLPGNVADIPTFESSITLKGTLKTDGTVSIKASAQGSNGSGKIDFEGATTLDLNKLGMTADYALDQIEKGTLNLDELGVKIKLKASMTTVKKGTGSASFSNSLGSVENRILVKENLYETKAPQIQSTIPAFSGGLRP